MTYRLKIYFTLIAFFFIYQVSRAQSDTRAIDSLKVHLSTTESKIERVKTMLVLSKLIGKSDAKSALTYAEESMQLANEIHLDTIINKAIINLARAYLQIGNYPKSLNIYQGIIKSKTSNANDLLAAYNGIGIINYYQRNYKNAIKYYNKALTFSSSDKSEIEREKKLKESLLNNLGIIYEEMKEFDKANFFYTEALKICKQLKDEENLAHVLTNQGRLFHKQDKNKQALQYYLEALAIRKKNNDESGITLSYDGLGEFYFELKKYDIAETYLRDAIKLGQHTGDLLTVRRASSNLYKLYQQLGNYKLAFESLALNKQVSDTLFNAERSNKITQLEMQFEFDRKQNEEKARQREKELTYLLAGIGLTLSLIIVSLLFYLQRNKVKNSLLEQAHLKLEKENLEKGIELKNKELTTNILHLIQKNELIDHISEKLLKIKQNVDEETRPAMQKVVTDLQSNLRPELLKEFEFRFQQIHEDFYNVLNERFPNLSPSERKLCAFLKLNMTTKEISAITHQNTKSIEIARTRLRKKLNLTGLDYNLVTFLSQLDRF
jgi:tetratricopeptide (TPR) repeat protein